MARPASPRSSGSVFGPALLLGAGLGGFVDGILLHQILRWHHLLTARPDVGLTGNLVADGLFHAGTWLAVIGGLLWLWRYARTGPRFWPWTALIGPLLTGWGLFNMSEGVINHHLLNLHHVRSGPHQTTYDLGFLALGAVLILLGMVVHRRGRSTRTPSPPDQNGQPPPATPRGRFAIGPDRNEGT
jgi:uncharacterized membrane protein